MLAVADEVDPLIQHVTVRRKRADLVLAAGDLPWDYLEFLVSCLEVPVVFVPGNHDPRIDSGVSPDGQGPRGAVNADVDVVEAAGLRIAGLGGCVRYNDGSHQYTQAEYDRRAKRLMRTARRRGAIDVLLTHAPPFELGDDDDPAHIGIKALHPVLEALRPPWHLHGHIHPYGRAKPDRRVGPTTITNVIPWRMLEIEPNAARPSTAGLIGRG